MLLRVQYLICFFIFAIASRTAAQSIALTILDQETRLPISDVHVFLSNSTTGSYTDENGEISLLIETSAHQDIIASHIQYELMRIAVSELTDTLYLTPSQIVLDDVEISAKRDKSWKKNYKRFERAFLGEGKEAKKCEILNPEVIRFEQRQGFLITTAIDVLHLKNEYLGYEIDFWLDYLILSDHDAAHYVGYGQYSELTDTPEDYKKIREEVYATSPRHFYQSLIDDQLQEDKYDLMIQNYANGIFSDIYKPERVELIKEDSTGQYILSFPSYLEVTDRRRKILQSQQSQLSVTGLESSRFSNGQHQTTDRTTFVKSVLHKTSEHIRLDRYGRVLNPDGVQEIGMWATLRMAHTLPWDYMPDDRYSSQLPVEDLAIFKSLLYDQGEKQQQALDYIRDHWKDSYTAPLMDILRLSADESLKAAIKAILHEQIGKDKIPNFYDGMEYLWSQEPSYTDWYWDFKGEIYSHVDEKFKRYFSDRETLSTIRLDEVLWGGVEQDGIPPLRYPEMIAAAEADYLDDDDIVFGMYINGVAKAYPQRILAWHEFVVDSFGDMDVAGVYCTLCGTVIAYDMEHGGQRHDLGTSGFLYRSNKLMYDRETQSLWSTIEGQPVIGPLVGQDIQLTQYPVTTTSWRAWKEMHSDTEVLSLRTGHRRDYTAGAAYREYYSHDRLMFPVPTIDTRLKNKEEVLVIRAVGYQDDPVALSISYLKRHPLTAINIDGQSYIVIAGPDGSSMTFEANDLSFDKKIDNKLIDDQGEEWVITPESLVHSSGRHLSRVPTHRIFWFAWYSVYPDTRLID